MANVQEAVRRLTIESTTRGVTETTDKLKQLQAAQQGVTVTSQSQERATLSMEKRLESIQRKYDQSYRAQGDLSRLERDLTAARNQGLVTQQRQNELLRMAAERHKGAAGAIATTTASLSGFASSLTRVAGIFGISLGVGALVSASTGAIKALGDIADEADRVGVSTAVLQTLQFELRQSGGASEDAASGLARFGKAAADAAQGGNYLSKIFQANGISLKEQNGTLRTSDALLQDYARLVANAGSQQEKLLLTSEAFGRAAGPKMVAMLERIAKEGLAGVVAQAERAGVVIDDTFIRKGDEIDDKFGKTLDRMSAKFKTFVVTVVEGWERISNKLSEAGQNPTSLSDALSAGALVTQSGLMDTRTRAGQDELDRFYGSTGAGSSGRPSVTAAAPRASAGRTVIPSRTESAYGRTEESIRKHIAMMEAEAKAAGGTAGQLEKLRVESQMLEAAHQAGIPTTDALTKKIEGLGNEAASAADKLARARLRSDIQFDRDQLGRSEIEGSVAGRLRASGLPVDLGSVEAGMLRVNEQLRIGKDLTMEFASGFARDMRNGVDATEALGNALTRLSDRLVDLALDQAISGVFGAATKGLGGGVGGGLAAGLGGLFGGFARGGVFDGGNVIPFARGGVVSRPTLFPMANGAGLMGEAGPEAVMPLRRGSDGRLGVAASGGAPVFNLSVVNNNGSQVQPQATRNESGGMDIQVIIDDAVGKSIASGRQDRVLQGRFNLGRPVARR